MFGLFPQLIITFPLQIVTNDPHIVGNIQKIVRTTETYKGNKKSMKNSYYQKGIYF